MLGIENLFLSKEAVGAVSVDKVKCVLKCLPGESSGFGAELSLSYLAVFPTGCCQCKDPGLSKI